MSNNVKSIRKGNLCTSCGICVGACPKGCIDMEYGKERNLPTIREHDCIDCGLCYKICPGKGYNLFGFGQKLFNVDNRNNYNRLCGFWNNSYVGNSQNENIRFHSSSGGVVSSFLIYLLKKGIIDGSIVVRFSKDDPLGVEPFIATTESEILSSRGSKYIIVSYDKIVEKIKQFKGRLAVVGLPCHIQALRNLSLYDKNVDRKIVGYFSIYCSLNKTKHSIDYYLSRYKVPRNKIGKFSFRDDGCMGFMKFTNHEGQEIKKIPYLSYWLGTHSFFVNSRCLVCADHFGEVADISFGDINISPYNQDKIGISSIITRNSYWDKLLNLCYSENEIFIKKLPIEEVLRSQGYSKLHKKGAGIKTNIILRKIFGQANPKYDIDFEGKPKTKDFLKEGMKIIMRRIGRVQSLWWIIKLFDRKSQ